MKRIALAAAASLMLATSATAGGIAFSFPTLTFAPTSDVTVSKDCLTTNITATTCSLQQ